MKTVVLSGLLVCFVARPASAGADPATTFARNCRTCHTFGQGVLVGPDLKGVTDRRSREWLTAWISSSETLIRSGDPTAVALFDKFNQQRMPDQPLTPGALSALLDYMAAGGPEADARQKGRPALTATAAEIEMGRTLFVGEQGFVSGGAPCVSCHRAGASARAGGTLGPDLSRAYARFQDKALSALLARGCFPRVPYGSDHPELTERESFALRAFLRYATKGTR